MSSGASPGAEPRGGTSGAAPSSDRGAAARDLLAVLYPPPHVVGLTGREGAPARARWIAIPSADHPRLLVPLARPMAATRMLRRQLTGNRPRTRMARAGLSLATATGVLSWAPGMRLEVVGPATAPSIEGPLCEVLGVPTVRLTLPIGPARANRKPVLQLTDPSGRVLAFAKVGHNELTGRLVRNEAAALDRLTTTPLRELDAPRSMALVEWQGRTIVVLEPLHVPRRRLAGAAARRRLIEVVAEVASVGGQQDVTWSTHPYRVRLQAWAGACDPDGRLGRLVAQIPADLVLPTGSWHGDLNAGNLALVRGRCPVWDWERFESGVPVGFDLLHHELHAAIAEGQVSPATATAALLDKAALTLAPLCVAPSAAAAVARLYLITLACRYLADDQDGAGADLGRIHDWLLPVLEGATR